MIVNVISLNLKRLIQVKGLLEKKYVVATARLESKEIVSLEALDEGSTPQFVRTVVFRLGKDEYDALGKPPVGSKLKLTVEPSET